MAWTPDYATSEQLKAYARIDDTLDDAQVSLAIAAASRAVDKRCNRQFGIVDAPEERLFTPWWDRRRNLWVIDIDDVMTAPATVEFDAGAVTAYRLEPVNAAQKSRPWTRLAILPGSSVRPSGTEFEAAITALWGWSAVPDAVTQATLLQANRILARRESPFGVAGSPDMGSEIRLLEKLDPDVSMALGPYVRHWGAA